MRIFTPAFLKGYSGRINISDFQKLLIIHQKPELSYNYYIILNNIDFFP